MNAEITDVVAENRARFDVLTERSAAALRDGRPDRAAAFIQSAARYAWYNHPGIFRSERLEDLAAQIGLTVADPQRIDRHVGDHVLHVATQVYGAGGHTRLIERWIANDPGRTHSLILTAQGGLPVPRSLRGVVEASGGSVSHAGRARGRLLARAARLRQAAFRGPSAILLHTHPHDVLPSLALRDVPAPVALINHADHVLGLGSDIATVLVDIRPAGRRLSLAARGIPVERSMLVPIPLTSPRAVSGVEARARWNIPEDAVVVVSIASAYKFGAAAGGHFVDVHRDYLRQHPHAFMLVVGPEPGGRWLEEVDGQHDRIRAVGMVDDIAPVYAAADIYADSLPFASLTSLLDAAARGVPVIAMAGQHAGTVLSSDDIALLDRVHFAEREDYLDELSRLTTDVEYRRERGTVLRAAVLDAHVPPAWTERLVEFYDNLRLVYEASDRAQGQPRSEQEGAGVDAALARFQIASGLAGDVWRSELEDAPLLDPRARLALFRRVPAGHRRGVAKYMVPEPARSAISGLAHALSSGRSR